MSADLSENVYRETHNGVCRITFSHPKANSLPGEVLASLAKHIEAAGAESETRVIVLQSAGEKAFCAGASFDELRAVRDEPSGSEFFSGFAAVINAMREAPQFIITRVQGKAVGGGVGLVAASDYALAHNSAMIKLSELALGIGPFVVGPAVERKLGTASFAELSIDADWRDAEWAHRRGLYARLFSTHAELDNAVTNTALTFSAYGPDATRELKRVLWQGTGHWGELLYERAAISGKLVATEFAQQILGSFD